MRKKIGIIGIIFLLFCSGVAVAKIDTMNLFFCTVQQKQFHYYNSLNSEIISFHSSTNDSILIVSLHSDQEMIVNNLSIIFDFNMSGIETYDADFHGYFCTNGEEIKTSFTSTWGEPYYEGVLRYLQVQSKFFEYLYDNRSTSTHFIDIHSDAQMRDCNISLPAGTWHFIYTAGFFDLEPEETPLTMSVWMNITSSDDDLLIQTSEGGKLYLLSYTEFDSLFTISKPPNIEIMIQGQATFHSNHTFLYDLVTSPPSCQGISTLKVQTPLGLKQFRGFSFRNHWFYRGDSHCYGAFSGVGPAGDYEIYINSIVYVPLLLRKWLSWPFAFEVYFVGLDVYLPEIN